MHFNMNQWLVIIEVDSDPNFTCNDRSLKVLILELSLEKVIPKYHSKRLVSQSQLCTKTPKERPKKIINLQITNVPTKVDWLEKDRTKQNIWSLFYIWCLLSEHEVGKVEHFGFIQKDGTQENRKEQFRLFILYETSFLFGSPWFHYF